MSKRVWPLFADGSCRSRPPSLPCRARASARTSWRGAARVQIRCGSGTYLRSIARDLGRQLGVGGYLGRLVRTAYGPLEIQSAVKLDALTNADDVRDVLQPAEVILPDMQPVRLNVVGTNK